MSTLIDACNAIEGGLIQSSRECELILAELSNFENYIACLPIRWMKLRLRSIALQIKVSETSLYEEHGGKGFVFNDISETIKAFEFFDTFFEFVDFVFVVAGVLWFFWGVFIHGFFPSVVGVV